MLSGCASSPHSTGSARPSVGSTAGGTSASDTAAVLAARADVYHLIQSGNYSAIYENYLSDRCKDKVDESEWVTGTRQHNSGRDFSGPERTSATVSGGRATVLVTA